MEQNPEEILTLAEAAKFAKVSGFTLRAMISSGRLRAVQIGLGSRRRHSRIAKKDLLAFFGIEQASHGEAGGASPAPSQGRTPTPSRTRARV